jgi:putative SOS response-associated peptidase YedK
MCGRFVQIADPLTIRAGVMNLDIDEAAVAAFRPRYNVAPTQDILAVLNTPAPRLTLTRWGLIPSWAKDPSMGGRLINARAETLSGKPSFRDAYRKRRCLIFADGFYEWKTGEKAKTPFLLRMKSGSPFALAGLWERWQDRDSGREVLSSTIVTTGANGLVAPIHDRMPVILGPEDYGVWLTPGRPDDAALASCLKPYPPEPMEAYEVSRLVNDPRSDSPEYIRPA